MLLRLLPVFKMYLLNIDIHMYIGIVQNPALMTGLGKFLASFPSPRNQFPKFYIGLFWLKLISEYQGVC